MKDTNVHVTWDLKEKTVQVFIIRITQSLTYYALLAQYHIIAVHRACLHIVYWEMKSRVCPVKGTKMYYIHGNNNAIINF